MSGLILRDKDLLSEEYVFSQKTELASRIASNLDDVIKQQKLAVNIQGNQYVTAEGWNTLGTMLGTYAKTEEVVPFKGFKGSLGYKARVSIMQGNLTLATAEAIAVKNNRQKEEHAVYSMAQTRAMGKAYRMAFSWIVKMAGYEPTPFEEMPDEMIHKQEKKESKKPANPNNTEQSTVGDIMPNTELDDETVEKIAGKSKSLKLAIDMLNKDNIMISFKSISEKLMDLKNDGEIYPLAYNNDIRTLNQMK